MIPYGAIGAGVRDTMQRPPGSGGGGGDLGGCFSLVGMLILDFSLAVVCFIWVSTWHLPGWLTLVLGFALSVLAWRIMYWVVFQVRGPLRWIIGLGFTAACGVVLYGASEGGCARVFAVILAVLIGLDQIMLMSERR